jgi:serine/threonine protein kinase
MIEAPNAGQFMAPAMGIDLDRTIMARCSTCQREIPSDAPGGLCPVCAFGMARSQPKSPADMPTQEMASHFPEQVPTPEMLSRMLPQFEVQELIGVGGMGAVYRARQPKLDRPIALKIMSSRFAKQPAFAERFAREARLLARLNHPHIVSVYDFGEVNGFCYLVMEFVDGINLREAISGGRLPADEVLQIVQQVCEALQFAHDQGVVHRDIKPENMILHSDGRLQLTDFGIAKVAQRTIIRTMVASGSGTIGYMAPEQAMGRPSAKSDVFSLGLMSYRMLAGVLPEWPFEWPQRGYANLRRKAHPELIAWLKKSLESRPSRRYQDANDMLRAFHSAKRKSLRKLKK